jgi:hypothetical protein
MVKNGDRVKVGNKYAMLCSYKHAAGKKGTLHGKPYTKYSPYQLRGVHEFIGIVMDNGDTWEIHVDDAGPLVSNNKEAKMMLDKEW